MYNIKQNIQHILTTHRDIKLNINNFKYFNRHTNIILDSRISNNDKLIHIINTANLFELYTICNILKYDINFTQFHKTINNDCDELNTMIDKYINHKNIIYNNIITEYDNTKKNCEIIKQISNINNNDE